MLDRVKNEMESLRKRMVGAIEVFKKELSGLRTGRASVNLLDPIVVEVYGSRMPITQLGTVTVPEPRSITVQVWDKDNVKAVEKSIREAGLGLNPVTDGQVVRVPLPDLSQERRQELTKVAGKYAESARVALRNVRRDGMEFMKNLEKKSEISEDESHTITADIQKMTDEHVKQVDVLLHAKEKEIVQI